MAFLTTADPPLGWEPTSTDHREGRRTGHGKRRNGQGRTKRNVKMFGRIFGNPSENHYLCRAGGAGGLLLFSCLPVPLATGGLRNMAPHEPGSRFPPSEKAHPARRKAAFRPPKRHQHTVRRPALAFRQPSARFPKCHGFLRISKKVGAPDMAEQPDEAPAGMSQKAFSSFQIGK